MVLAARRWRPSGGDPRKAPLAAAHMMVAVVQCCPLRTRAPPLQRRRPSGGDPRKTPPLLQHGIQQSRPQLPPRTVCSGSSCSFSEPVPGPCRWVEVPLLHLDLAPPVGAIPTTHGHGANRRCAIRLHLLHAIRLHLLHAIRLHLLLHAIRLHLLHANSLHLHAIRLHHYPATCQRSQTFGPWSVSQSTARATLQGAREPFLLAKRG